MPLRIDVTAVHHLVDMDSRFLERFSYSGLEKYVRSSVEITRYVSLQVHLDLDSKLISKSKPQKNPVDWIRLTSQLPLMY
jgi:hypothetical protein